MKNIVTLPNSKRKNSLIAGILCSLAVLFGVIIFITSLGDEYVTEEDFTAHTVTVISCSEKDDGYYLAVEEHTLPLWIPSSSKKHLDVFGLVAIPAGETINVKLSVYDLEAYVIDIFVGEVAHGQKVLLSLQDTISTQKNIRLTTKIVGICITAVAIVGACVAWVIFAKNKKEIEQDVFSAIAHNAIGPQARERSRTFIAFVVILAVSVVAVATFGILSDLVNPRFDVAVLIFGGIMVADLIALPVINATFVRKREIEFYDSLFSFSPNVLPEHTIDVGFDHANGVVYVFTEAGILPLAPGEEQAVLEGLIADSRKEDYTGDTAFEEYSKVPYFPPYLNPSRLIPYDALHFKSLAFFANSHTRITILITAETQTLVQNTSHDLCMVLDGDFYCTLKKFNVQVKGLKETIKNRKTLMLNAKSRKPKPYVVD